MNETFVVAAWKCEVPVPNWRFVLAAMATFSDSPGFYRGGVEWLSELTGLDDSCVTNALLGLEAKKIITPCAQGSLDGFHINLIEILRPEVKTSQIAS